MTTERTNPSVPANNTTPQGGQPYGDEIDLVELAQKVWAKRKMILRNTAIGAVVGIVVAFSIPKEYKTTVKLAPENASQAGGAGNMGALAAMAGINIGGAGTDGLTPSLYPDIVASTPFLMELKDMPVTTLKDQQTYTLYEYMTEHQKSPWWSKLMALPGKAIGGMMSLFSDKEEEQAETWNPFQLTRNQERFLQSLSSVIKIAENKKSGILSVDVQLQDPLISALIADSVVSKLQSYMINYKTVKSRNDLSYAQKLYNEAQLRYFEVQKQYAQYEDANKNVVSAKYAIEKERMQNEATLAFAVYNNLAQQVEMAKAKVQQDTPVVTILEPAKVALEASKPNKKILFIVIVFLACFFSVASVLIKDIIVIIK
ncbi:MAG: Wzz/FepE/Etk N-terminal domain-containing protein [Tannerellaceae bacterium]